MDLELFFNENYLVFLLLGGLLVIMYAYRDVRLPASRNFVMIIFTLLAMCLASGIEAWARDSSSRELFRMGASVVHYILQPLVIYLELTIIMPGRETASSKNKLLLALPILINSIIYLIAPFTGSLVFNYDENYFFNRGPLGYSIYVVTFIYLLLLFYWSFRFLNSSERRKGIMLFFMVGIGVLTGILEYLNVVTGYIDEAFALGVFLYYMYLVTLHESEMLTRIATQELEISRSRVRLMRQQIRPHFVFNSLHIIKSLIRTDQDKAVECVEDFSDYLRANIDAISSDSLISFNDELTHIKAYVSLALADESKGIKVMYDLKETDFRLPPLSIEPLVENAIRHGLTDGGDVTLSTCSAGDDIVITVSDTGKGFETDGTDKEKQRIGAGIENVRTRLAMLCNGTLDILSGPDGTEVTVRIPK